MEVNNVKHRFDSLYFPFRLLLFYIVALTLWRILFIYFNEAPDFILCLKHALRLDIAMICAVFLASYIPWLLFLFTGHFIWKRVSMGLQFLVWMSVCIIEFASILMYKEWGTSLDFRGILYMLHPQEAWSSVKDYVPLGITFFGLVILVSGIKRLHQIFQTWHGLRSHLNQSIGYVIFMGGLGFLGLRGGLQKLPISPTDGFYSSEMVNNFAALNKPYYLIYSIINSKNIQLNINDADIQKFQDDYHQHDCQNDSIEAAWKNKNIILLAVEGWSMDMVNYLMPMAHVTPFFDSLASCSLRYTNAFSTGFRTDQGLMSIISGVPSIQGINMPTQMDHVSHFPSLARVLKKSGRSTSFIYGGDLNFSNLYNYLLVMGFDTIIRDKSFKSNENLTAWGVPDHLTVVKAVDVIHDQNAPFFSTILLLSSHAPFEVPIKNDLSDATDIVGKYKAAVQYSDESLRRFFELAHQEPWFENTVFIITSDHGNIHSGYAKKEDHRRFRIPMIIYDASDALSLDQKSIYAPCNHFDLPKTIADLTGQDDSEFIFGRNILCNDSLRNAYWNTETVAAKYSLKAPIIEYVGNVKPHAPSEAALFLEMTKRWYKQFQ